YSLIHWGSARHVVIEPGARFALLGIAFLPTPARPAFPWPPMIAVSIAVDYAFAGQRDVLLLECIDERRVVHQLHAFPASENQRQIFLRISFELAGHCFSNVQLKMYLHANHSHWAM